MNGYQRIKLDDYDDVNGLYEVWYNNDEVYEGKIVNSKRHGYGIMNKYDRKNNTKEIIYDGIWVNDEPIDDIPLPEITHLNTDTNSSNLNINTTCEHVTFNYKNFAPKTNNIINEVNLAYYVPFGGGYDLYDVKKKAIMQTGLSFKDNKIEVKVTNSICNNLENLGQCINVANDINNISNYIIELDEDCSNCMNFNRSWVCCGQFAPFLYIYVFLLFGNINDFIEKHSFNKNKKDRIPSYINDVATVFYKVFTSYGIDDKRYHRAIDNIYYDYHVSIPTVLDNDNNVDNWDWFIPYKNEYSKTDFADNTPYLITLNYKENPDEVEVNHYSFIYRYGNYIIITDSWSHNPIGERYPVTRIIEIDMFINCLNTVNKSYEIINNILKSNNISRDNINAINSILNGDNVNISNDINFIGNNTNPDVIKLLQEFLLYNFIMDAFFLIPYFRKSININIQAFEKSNISQIRIVNPEATSKVFEIISNPSKIPDDYPDAEPFIDYLGLGGFNKIIKKQTYKRKKGNKKQSKKRKRVKKQTYKRKKGNKKQSKKINA